MSPALQNKLRTLSMQETKEILKKIRWIDSLTSKNTMYKHYLQDIYENYEFSYNEIMELIDTVSYEPLISFESESTIRKRKLAAINKFIATHNRKENINSYVDTNDITPAMARELKLSGKYDEDESLTTILKREREARIKPAKVLSYGVDEMEDINSEINTTSRDIEVGSKLNNAVTDTIAKATGDESKEFSAALSSVIIDSMPTGQQEQNTEKIISVLSSFEDVLKMYKKEYGSSASSRKEELVLEVARPIMDSLEKLLSL